MANKYQEKATVISQERIGQDIYSLWLKTERIAAQAKPGQFVSLYCRDSAMLLPRPISICRADAQDGRLRLVYRVAGKGTLEFSKYVPGQTVDMIGPLGNGFPVSLVTENSRVFLIGGGIGIPPMIQLAAALPGEKQIVLGFRDEQFLVEELAEYGKVYIATEDGSAGTRGNVLDCIREHALSGDIVFACGPTPMLRALKAWAGQEQLPCYLSLEEKMACGIGACLACVCQTTDTDEHSRVKNKRICVEGPVFEASEIAW